mmetsp:Transcript_18988/g.72482  ORF Transcript_18988/g.72482 Transcript_18988/m.72482 type:complete len:203 (+) Transcript_18988:2465-3073(+)
MGITPAQMIADTPRAWVPGRKRPLSKPQASKVSRSAATNVVASTGELGSHTLQQGASSGLESAGSCLAGRGPRLSTCTRLSASRGSCRCDPLADLDAVRGSCEGLAPTRPRLARRQGGEHHQHESGKETSCVPPSRINVMAAVGPTSAACANNVTGWPRPGPTTVMMLASTPLVEERPEVTAQSSPMLPSCLPASSMVIADV